MKNIITYVIGMILGLICVFIISNTFMMSKYSEMESELDALRVQVNETRELIDELDADLYEMSEDILQLQKGISELENK